MFLRRYTRKKSGKTHSYYALVESIRTKDGTRQRVVAHLGELNHNEERRWQRTTVFYNRHGDAKQLRLFPEDDTIALPGALGVVELWGSGRRLSLAQIRWGATKIPQKLYRPYEMLGLLRSVAIYPLCTTRFYLHLCMEHLALRRELRSLPGRFRHAESSCIRCHVETSDVHVSGLGLVGRNRPESELAHGGQTDGCSID